MHNIRGLKIILCRVKESTASGPKRKLLGNINKGYVRSNVIWIPTDSTAKDKAAKTTKVTKAAKATKDTKAAKRHVVISTVNEASQKKGL